MFIGEGPGKDEEVKGRPFIGRSGQLLRRAIDRLGLTDYYISNITLCRHAVEVTDTDGNTMYRKDYQTGRSVPRVKDEPPTQAHINACLPRLHEEIYLVDPVLIVALGGTAVQTLTRQKIALTRDRSARIIEVPGAWHIPSLTEKKKVWYRKIKGEVRMPVSQNTVQYLLLPTFHPAHVGRRWADRSLDNPLDAFINDMKAAAKIYDRYVTEVYGTHPAEREMTASDIIGDDDDG
jgi:uracil-DNA glycosylase